MTRSQETKESESVRSSMPEVLLLALNAKQTTIWLITVSLVVSRVLTLMEFLVFLLVLWVLIVWDTKMEFVVSAECLIMQRLICPMSLLVVQKVSMPLPTLNARISLNWLTVYRLTTTLSATNAPTTSNSTEDSVKT